MYIINAYTVKKKKKREKANMHKLFDPSFT